jgi:BCD family chlorophyll transporter-like MFS transporter
MIGTAIIGTTIGKSRESFMRGWTVFGCLASAVAMAALCCAAIVGPAWPLEPTVFALGVSSGIFTIGAISSMMTLASSGKEGREGTRMGMWGASQAIAFGSGGFLGAAALDAARAFLAETAPAFAFVFAVEAVLFVGAAACAVWVGKSAVQTTRPIVRSKEFMVAE